MLAASHLELGITSISDTSDVSAAYIWSFPNQMHSLCLRILMANTLLQDVQSSRQLLTELCGFSTIVIGTFLLNATKDWDGNMGLMPPARSGAPFNALRPVHDDSETQVTSKSAGLGRISSAFSSESNLLSQSDRVSAWRLLSQKDMPGIGNQPSDVFLLKLCCPRLSTCQRLKPLSSNK